MGFLCRRHRELLTQYPVLARQRWEEWLGAGQQAMTAQQWTQAIRLLGSSYEISEHLLEHPDRAHDHLSPIDRLMLSGHLLAECFGRSGNRPLERHYLLAVHHRLTRDIPNPAALPPTRRKNLEISLLMLKRHCRLHGPFCGLEACLAQGAELLGQRAATVH